MRVWTPMKILFNPAYTGKPTTCPTSHLVWEIISSVIKWRKDIYFYVMYPTEYKNDDEQMKFPNKHSKWVTLVGYGYNTRDKVSELFKFPNTLVDMSAPISSSVWDAGMIVTSRMPQIPMSKVNSGRPSGFISGSYRTTVGLEEMPILSFRKTVLWSKYFDLQTMSAYIMSSGIIVNNLWTKNKLRKISKTQLPPSKSMELDSLVY